MTDYLQSARVLLDSGNLIDSDLALVQIHALIALAESAARIADHLGSARREDELQSLLESAEADIDRREAEVARLQTENAHLRDLRAPLGSCQIHMMSAGRCIKCGITVSDLDIGPSRMPFDADEAQK